MGFEENKVLFGHDPEERIVAVAIDENGAARLYSRQADGSPASRAEAFRPFLWADSEIADERLSTNRLKGELDFGFVAECADWGHFTALRNGLKNTGIKFFALNDPVQQYLLQSGKTLFKGMEFDELRRMQLALDGDGAVTASDNRGWSERFAGIAELGAAIRGRDPDVIEGHELFRKILPAISARAKKEKVKLAWGRDGGLMASRASRIQVAEKTINYPKFEARGRHFVDTFLLAQFWDVGARELESYELADVAAHFHITAADAVSQTRELAVLLSASYFVQAKIFPYNYQDVVVRGNATKIDALLLREYHRQAHSVPDLPVPRPFAGGYTDIFFTGVAKNVQHCDVASLYPSVMLQFDCLPVADQLGLFRHLLSDLRQFRLEAKARMRAAPSAERAGLNALQSTFKILINSFYGYLGFAQAHFADFDAASRVTEIGRDLLKKMVDWLQKQGAQVIEIDTDGIYFVPPADEPIAKLQSGLMGILPKGIEVEFDAHYKAMFSYKAKNYALLSDEGELTITGGALKSRGLEKFQRVFLEEMIKFLMDENFDAVAKLHADYEGKIRNREWPVEFFMKTDTLQDSLAQYVKKIEATSRNRAAAYELAVKSGRNYQPGDQVSYYITGAKKNVSAYENSRLATEWDPAARDENVEYYVAKLNDLMKKFADFVKPSAQPGAGQMQLI